MTPSHTVLDDPRFWAATFVRAVAEIFSGRRPPGALNAFVTPQVRRVLHRRPIPGQRHALRGPHPVRTLRVQTQQPADDVVEGHAILLGQDGARAVAFRMEICRGRWVCTALETQRPAHAGTLVRP